MKIAIVFPGFGSHYVGMAKDLYDEHRIVQEYFEEASSCLGTNVVKLCFASSEAELGKMANAQTAVFLISSAIYHLLVQHGVKPELLVGYNTGVYAALHASGSLSFPDGLYLLNKYAALYQEATSSIDAASVQVFGAKTDLVEQWCAQATTMEQQVNVAVYLSETNHIVSGQRAAMEQFTDYADQQSVTVKSVDPAVGLHSPLLDNLCDMFSLYLNKVDFKSPNVMMLSLVNGRLVMNEMEARAQVIDLINKPIRLQHLIDVVPLYDLIIELGPGTYLSSIIKKQVSDKQVMAVNRRADFDALMNLISEKSTTSQS